LSRKVRLRRASCPRSPYAAAKLYAHWMTANYRESSGMHASSGILFNHESPLRGFARQLALGNLDARRDWGHARDYVRAMWLMLQRDTPMDFVVATGRNASIRDFAHLAFSHAGLNWEDHVVQSQSLLRPAEVEVLLGDPGLARAELGWEATVTLEALAAEMVEADLARLRARMAA
jgi:GDPmannose 4,6-dehydratase